VLDTDPFACRQTTDAGDENSGFSQSPLGARQTGGVMGWQGLLRCSGRALVLSVALWLTTSPAAQAAPQGEWVGIAPPIAILATGGSLLILADGTPLLFGLEAAGVQEYHPGTGDWTARGSLQLRRGAHATATLLPVGVLLSGGEGSAAITAEIYDPASNISTLIANMHIARAFHQATLLSSGKVIVSGGVDTNNQLVGPTEIYDPRSGAWVLADAPNQPRAGHAALRLQNGRVLIAGGTGASGALASAEIYDPVTERWISASAMDRPRFPVLAIELRDGRILVTGYTDGVNTSQIYDPVSNSWTPSAPTGGLHTSGLVMLHDGTPLVVSLSPVPVPCFRCSSRPPAAALFDVQTGRWNTTAQPGLGVGPLAVLPDGRVLLGASSGTQLFRPDNSTPRLTPSPLSVDFGKTSVSVPVQQVITVQNSGGGVLTGNATTGTPFTIVSGSSFTLAAGASASLTVQFTPPKLGAFTGAVVLRSNVNSVDVKMTAAVGVGAYLSGRVTDATATGVAGITVNLTGGTTGSTVTDTAGHYQFFVPLNNGYNVTPASVALRFSPSVRTVIVGTQDVSELDFSAGFVDNVAAFIAGLYENALGRAPDAPGFAYWTDRLRQQCNRTELSVVAEEGFFDSPEFRRRTLTLTSLVTAIYQALLQRSPDLAGHVYWSHVLRQQRLSLVTSFIDSPEFRRLLPDRTDRQAVTTVVVRLYAEILGRTADALEIAGWVNYITATGDVEGAAPVFFTSQDFEQRALTFGDYVTILYRAILGRDPEAVGFDYWNSVLRSGLRSVVKEGFLSSSEFQGLVPTFCGG
jgi:uncharacterized protein DUF4214/HYDIN/CFA65/VesB family protein/Kelch motif protein